MRLELKCSTGAMRLECCTVWGPDVKCNDLQYMDNGLRVQNKGLIY